jgi:hypothetical protein
MENIEARIGGERFNLQLIQYKEALALFDP